MVNRLLTLLFVFVGISKVCFSTGTDKIVVKSNSESKVHLFPLEDIHLLDSEFKKIEELDHQYLVSLDPDRLLSWFRREAGLTSQALPYPFWESEDVWGGGPLAGHIMGFYLSSMSMMYATTKDPYIIERLNYTLQGLNECQEAQGDGYLLATIKGKQLFEEVSKGNFETNNPTINGIWEPVYIMNKVMLGLYGAYIRCNLPLAKDILVKMADWFGKSVLDKLNHEQIQKLLVCEHGSINESFVNVYMVTGDKKYLNWAKELNDEDMWVPASEKRDVLNGWHANTQIPKFTGFENVYNYTGDTKYTDAARFFWETVVNKHTWVNGGNSTGEHFFPQSEFENRVSSIGGPESCNSVNMMRLTEILYTDYADPKMVDYYEKVLFNHILANYEPNEGMCAYYTSMRPGHYKMYGTKYDSFWCCTGTGMEAPAKFGKMIYAYKGSDLYVNLFIPSTVNWGDKNIKITQRTKFPDEDKTELQIETKSKVVFNLKVRCPYWGDEKKMYLKINGKPVRNKAQNDGYINIERDWSNGDKVEISFSPKLTLVNLPASSDYAAFMYGPIVLAAQINNFGLEESDMRIAKQTVARDEIPLQVAHSLYGKEAVILKSLNRLPDTLLRFECPASVASEQFDLIPFNRIHFNRYEIYFPVYPDQDKYSKALGKELKTIEEFKNIENQTIDRIKLYNPASNKEHKLDGVGMETGYSEGLDWRRAKDGGYFMYEMKVLPQTKHELYLLFSRNDSVNSVFDVMVNGKVIATMNLSNPEKETSNFYSKRISIPEYLIGDKNSITVKLQAKKNKIAGAIFDLRILRQ